MSDKKSPPKKKWYPKQKPKVKPVAASPVADTRRTAMSLLKAICSEAKPVVEHALADHEYFQLLDERDQAFTRQLVLMTLRYKGLADRVIKTRLSRPIPDKYHDVMWILRLGVVQLLWMRVPDYAAVNSSVVLAKQCDFQMHSALVNAVLSGVAREREYVMEDLAQEAQYVLPLWLWRRWSAQYGEAKASLMAESLLLDPQLDISVKLSCVDDVDVEELEAVRLPSGSIRRALSGTDVPALQGFAEGKWWVQDAAAAIPARLLGDVAGLRIVDACAAPGGKTAQLASAGAQVIAVDMAAERLARLRENMKRLSFTSQVEVVCENALDWQPEQLVDGVLLDAPCSATGTLRRHPEGLWQKKEEDVARLVLLQRDLLRAASAWLKPEGVLVYATCSLEYEEGEGQIASFCQENTHMVVAPITQREAVGLGIPKQWITKQGMLRILPHYWQEYGGVDGFFAARLKRIA